MRMREQKTTTKSPTAKLIAQLLDKHPEYSQSEIADRIGFKGASRGVILTQIKNERTKMPFQYIRPFCKMLGEDPRPLLSTAVKEYYFDVADSLIEEGFLDADLFDFAVDPDSIKPSPKLKKVVY